MGKINYVIRWRGTLPEDEYDPYVFSRTLSKRFNNVEEAITYLWQRSFTFRWHNDHMQELKRGWCIRVEEERDLDESELVIASNLLDKLKIEQKRIEKIRKLKQEERKQKEEYDLYLKLKNKFDPIE